MSLFLPTYFSPISQYSAIINAENIVFEVEDNFQKQTYRNRCYIYGANGKQLLNIPVKHPKTEGRKKTKDTLVENVTPWQSQHLKSLQSAYRTSPFFEFYIDDLMPIFTKEYTFLIDVNIDTFSILTDALQLPSNYSITTEYELLPKEKDFRNLAIDKKGIEITIPQYIQMFDDKHGFLPNLSLLDLLFMEGPNAISVLEKIKLHL
ncbi:hypothetical protein LPB136_00985 [Tenacibaculum todarodis]|uniref:WbqC-like protein n=1 Tax=Tenacibaculum todarodis TaxID=1850252 RepID=A0A1L3JFZ1_9FLAO|nr:WbqC family protein [Tenacibaculum todarodis]APG64029.1 hypothetical protein LPB136_00985 [Tenacibaculum todarodis]